MKHIFFSILLFAAFGKAEAQFFSIGLKGGLNSPANQPGDIIVIGEGDQAFDFKVEDLKFGAQFGGYLRFGRKFFFQPEVLLNSSKAEYSVKQSNLPGAIYSEKYLNLDVPLLLGIKMGPIRIVGGPVAHHPLNSKSELTDLDGYKAMFDNMKWGYQTGLNISLGRVSADLRYEGNFSKFGDHVTFFGDDYKFSTNPARFIFGLNFALIK